MKSDKAGKSLEEEGRGAWTGKGKREDLFLHYTCSRWEGKSLTVYTLKNRSRANPYILFCLLRRLPRNVLQTHGRRLPDFSLNKFQIDLFERLVKTFCLFHRKKI